MKKTVSAILICVCLIVMHVTALAANGITVTASSSKAESGDELTVSGTATADTWISIEGTDNDGNILYFSAALSDAAGAYSVTFKAPDMDDGTLTLTAGNGDMTAKTAVKIYTPALPVLPPVPLPALPPVPLPVPLPVPIPAPAMNRYSSTADASATSAQASQTPEASEASESTGKRGGLCDTEKH